MHIACSLPKTTNTHSGYVILIAFPLQQWLHELASVLRYTCNVCLVIIYHYDRDQQNCITVITTVIKLTIPQTLMYSGQLPMYKIASWFSFELWFN